MNRLLLSNSTAPGLGPLDHALDAVAELLGDRREIVFVPYTLADHDAYTTGVAAALEPLGVVVVGAHDGDPAARLSDCFGGRWSPSSSRGERT
ncbi:Type 1 glutamine amidotransferase-like domain-containing protein [Pengzhenrongella sp.]|jgi:dipeptidase E|uniref:Type 1 glutamine amidotransferase-like domain-containing protein n=1 Tax=Pengzhenrongella sp. TaxID=2888820 RepID=UPI002F934331